MVSADWSCRWSLRLEPSGAMQLLLAAQASQGSSTSRYARVPAANATSAPLHMLRSFHGLRSALASPGHASMHGHLGSGAGVPQQQHLRLRMTCPWQHFCSPKCEKVPGCTHFHGESCEVGE